MSLVPIAIDARDLALEFNLTTGQVSDLKSYVVHEVAAAFGRNWDAQARMQLHSTRDTYRRSLIAGTEGPHSAYIMLVGQLPNMIEQGASAWDMKQKFSQSDKVKYTKKGKWYLTIPFRWATPGSLGENSIFTEVMPVSVYNAIRSSVGGTRTAPGGARSNGGGLTKGNIPGSFAIPRSRAAFSDIQSKTTFSQYVHKSSTYQGIIRSKKTYQSANQSQYVSFRRAGESSDPNSWIHKGMIARNLSQKAIQTTPVAPVVDKAVDEFLSNQGF